ncbi:MAG: type II toxin-antitoxin system HicB family antitoxin [Candidatus Eremiobacterota bacterium]
MRYAVIVERGPTSFGAYVPDLPGCVAVGKTLEEVCALIAEAVPFHLEGMRLRGEPIPEPSTEVLYADVPQAS